MKEQDADKVEVDDAYPLDQPLFAQHASGHHQPVEGAAAAAVVQRRVVEAGDRRHRHPAVGQRPTRGGEHPAADCRLMS